MGVGVVEENKDPHNVYITYCTGGSGLYCFVPGCEDRWGGYAGSGDKIVLLDPNMWTEVELEDK